MTTIPENRRMFYPVMYLLIVCVIAAALTSCSPYASNPSANQHQGSPTPAPSVTATPLDLSPVTNQEPTPRPSCTVTAYTLNMRTGAGMRHAVKDILHNGERVQILSRPADWLKVETAQRVTGWVYGKYIKCKGR
jgi:uncharacterized protein YgiM (DUF1202 family)